jgi:hypothetical protein
MKSIQQVLSDFINLIFASKDPKENEKLHGWGAISLLLVGLIIFIGVVVSNY